MGKITTKDGVEIFYKDWSKVSPLCSVMPFYTAYVCLTQSGHHSRHGYRTN
jgi:hypothetical protein